MKWLEKAQLAFCLQLQASSVLSASLDAWHMALCKTGAADKSGGFKAKGGGATQ